MELIGKVCADSLRTLAAKDYGIKLGSAHAHELVAAHFGYRSNAALIADTKYSLSKFGEAKIFISPPLDIFGQRIKELLGESSPLLSAVESLSQDVLSALMTGKFGSGLVFPTFKDLGIRLAKERLSQRWGTLGMVSDPVGTDLDVDIDLNEGFALLTVFASYLSSGENPERLKLSKTTISLPRVAANFGYGEFESEPTFYSGEARKVDSAYNTDWPPLGR